MFAANIFFIFHELYFHASKFNLNGFLKIPTKLQLQSILNTENVDALKTLRISRSRP